MHIGTVLSRRGAACRNTRADLVFAGPYPVIVYEQRVLGALVGRLFGGPFAQQHRADRSARLRNPDRSPCPVRDYEASPARFQIEGVADGSVRSRHAAADRMHVGRKVRSGEKASESRRKGPDAEDFLGQPFRDAGAPRMSQARIAALVVDRRAVRSERLVPRRAVHFEKRGPAVSQLAAPAVVDRRPALRHAVPCGPSPE